MIIIKQEESQGLYGVTNGCINCGTNKFKDDIKILKIIPKYGGCGLELTMCQKCRQELLEVLRQEVIS